MGILACDVDNLTIELFSDTLKFLCPLGRYSQNDRDFHSQNGEIQKCNIPSFGCGQKYFN